ncbi:hypothetical protein, partial [Sphingobium yanoikuyae]|uniref:hypothetical protein n=1 Tax=Sphingobium yanoikuyae TaxID=13690 RepID=UPI0035C7F5C4
MRSSLFMEKAAPMAPGPTGADRQTHHALIEKGRPAGRPLPFACRSIGDQAPAAAATSAAKSLTSFSMPSPS